MKRFVCETSSGDETQVIQTKPTPTEDLYERWTIKAVQATSAADMPSHMTMANNAAGMPSHMTMARNVAGMPSHMTMASNKALISYEGQPITCGGCNKRGHQYHECPHRKKTDPSPRTNHMNSWANIVVQGAAKKKGLKWGPRQWL